MKVLEGDDPTQPMKVAEGDHPKSLAARSAD